MTSSSTPAFEFARLEPIGGLALGSLANSGQIADEVSDTIDFTFAAEVGEAISAVATPANAGAVLSIQLLDSNGIIAAASAQGVGGLAVLPHSQLESDTAAIVRITSNVPTRFDLDIYRNVQLEAGIGDSEDGNALELIPTKIDGITRFAVVGNTAMSPSESVVYSESFDGTTTGFNLNDLWHVSSGRASDGMPNHSGGGLYFGQAELSAAPTGTLNWDASLDQTSNQQWESSNNGSATTNWSFGSNSNPGSNGGASNLDGVNEWYTFGPAATMDSIEDVRGDAVTEQDASFELVFRPHDFNGTHVLFETGGNVDGTGILLIDNELEVRVQNTDNNTRRVVRTFAFDTTRDVNKFHHVVFTIHPSRNATENQVRLFVNGNEVGNPTSATSVIADWGGTNASGLGRANGSFPDSDDTGQLSNFNGDISLFRFHENRLLSPAEVSGRYSNLIDGLDFVPGSYDTGGRAGGEAVSPPFVLSGDGNFTLTFNTLIEVEDAEEPFELMQVLVRDTATSEEEILLDRFDGTLAVDTLGEWVPAEVDLSPFRGQVVQVIFRFDSVDSNSNNFEGWWIDSLQVTRSDALSNDVDDYSVDLSAHVGEPVNILLASLSENANYQALELRDATGSTVLARAVADSNRSSVGTTDYHLGIIDHEITAPGVYTIRVVSNATTPDEEYGLVVAPGVAIENEPNEGPDSRPTFSTDALTFTGYLRSDAVETYESRAAFEANNPGLQHEDFEGGDVGPSDVTTFAGSLSSQTSNSAFSNGIVSGVTISASNSNLALVGGDFFDPDLNASKALGPDLFTANTIVSFSPPGTAVGLDILGNADVEVLLYDSSNELIQSYIVEAEPTGTFFGVASSQLISRLELVEVIRSGELIDNVSFGTAGVATTSDDDSFVLSLEAGASAKITTSTPLDGVAQSVHTTNTLDPRLTVTGPNTNLSDTDSADGKNASIEFTAPVAGDYLISVGAQSGEGEYIVHVTPPPLKGFINETGFIVLEANELDAQGLDFRSAGGFLIPAPNGDADPFDFALSNTANRVTFGNLGSTVRLDGRIVTNVRYVGDQPDSDLTAFVGLDSLEVPFNIDEATGSNSDPLDCNQDGSVDAGDLTCVCAADVVDELLNTLGLPPGDLNGDGNVDFPDFLALGRTFGQTSNSYAEGDLDCSGRVDFADFLILARNFGA